MRPDPDSSDSRDDSYDSRYDSAPPPRPRANGFAVAGFVLACIGLPVNALTLLLLTPLHTFDGSGPTSGGFAAALVVSALAITLGAFGLILNLFTITFGLIGAARHASDRRAFGVIGVVAGLIGQLAVLGYAVVGWGTYSRTIQAGPNDSAPVTVHDPAGSRPD